MVGLDNVTFLGLEPAEVTTVHVESVRRPLGCRECGSVAQVKDWVTVVLVDLPVYGRPTRLAWRKRRMECADADCLTKSWTEEDDRIASPRQLLELMTPKATLVADPFHVLRHANTKLDECRRRVQNETLGHRGRKSDPLYRGRRLLTKAKERLDDEGREKQAGLLRAGDPKGDVATVWEAKEAVRELYAHADADLALEWVTQLGCDLQDADYPIEARSLGRTLIRWRRQIAAWHEAHVTNGPTEAVNNLIKRVKRAAFGFMSFRNYRVRSLLYAGKPNWDLLSEATPR